MSTLKELRETNKMSKARLAREFGVTERTIYAWEKGEPVKRLVVLAYSGLFGTPPEEIDALTAGYVGAPTPPDPQLELDFHEQDQAA